jgi:predicted GNAT family acetyltransferase
VNPEILDIPIVDNKERGRFELTYRGHTAILEYRIYGATILFPHTLVPPPIEGNGIAARMSRHALDFARENNLSVTPACPFVAQFISENPEYADLVPAYLHRSYGIVIPRE